MSPYTSISAGETWLDEVEVPRGPLAAAWTGTTITNSEITVQRKVNDSWTPVKVYTSADDQYQPLAETGQSGFWRLGCASGDFTAGDAFAVGLEF